MRLSTACRTRPAFPSFLTFFATSVVGVASLGEQSLPTDGGFYVVAADIGLGLAILLLVVFAFATGSVLDRPRTQQPEQPDMSERSGAAGAAEVADLSGVAGRASAQVPQNGNASATK